MEPMQKLLITIGLTIMIIGSAWPYITKLGLGSLPGDINVQGDGYSMHFPIVTCLILSAVISGILWLVRQF